MSDRRERLDTPAVAGLLLCCGLWGLNQVATKLALAEVPPLTQAALRSLGAAVLVWLWSWGRGVALFERDATLAGGLAAGALFGLEFAAVFVGLQYTGASRMVVFVYLAPFVVALGMAWGLRLERLAPRQWLGLAVAFGGVAAAFAEGFGAAAGPRQWWGDALGVAGALLWGATTLTIRATPLAHAAPEKTLLYQLGGSGVLLGLAALAAGEVWPVVWSATTLWSLGFQVVVVSFASYLLWFWLVRHYPATQTAAFTLLTPIAGLLAGVALLDEPATPRLLGAAAAVVAGLWLVNRRR